ncbi:DUF4097 family beta strand repeat-containing protein [Spirosoma sp. KNUC1025]|uniref:DUF4097 family beta strand repeat-containing protein n=1 Tax=Spirosoma sp. KNUC1025 TaxID=2894082 RepID=UPI0038639F86|nr:hypothetical protein LN737_27210 [Spirosoma sp. KNUC1025]
MKISVFLLFLSLLLRPAFAQKIIEKSLPVTAGQLVNLNLKFADSIQVRYWDKPNVSVRIAVTINSGKLNDALTVTTGSTDKEVSVKTDFDKELIKQGKDADCPDKRYHSMHTDRDGKGYTICSEINYQVFVPRQAQLKVETINGNIDIQGANGPVFAKTISGYVDMSWPKSKGVNLAMQTITGEVYSDLDIDFKTKKEKNPIVGYLLEGTVNGGGPNVRLESISNNVYLRRKD